MMKFSFLTEPYLKEGEVTEHVCILRIIKYILHVFKNACLGSRIV